MAKTLIRGNVYSVAVGDEFSFLPEGGCIHVEGGPVTLEGKIVDADDWVPVMSGGTAMSFAEGIHQVDASRMPIKARFAGTATRIVLYGLIS